MQTKMPKMTFIRLCFSGSLAGIALMGVISPMFGLDASHVNAIGGIVGAGAVAIGFKLAHLA